MSVYAPTYCPGDPCDPCPTNAILRAIYEGAPLYVPSVAAQDVNSAVYHGETFDVTITFTVQNASVSVSGTSIPIYGFGRLNVYIPFPDAPIRIDLFGSTRATGTSSTGWPVFYIPEVRF